MNLYSLDILAGDEIPLACRGRLKPLASVRVSPEGIATIRVDFADEPALWAECELPAEVPTACETLRLANEGQG